jgi:hypothetical protein
MVYWHAHAPAHARIGSFTAEGPLSCDERYGFARLAAHTGMLRVLPKEGRCLAPGAPPKDGCTKGRESRWSIPVGVYAGVTMVAIVRAVWAVDAHAAHQGT